MNIQNKRHILLSLDTIMSWANGELPEDDFWGWIDGYGLMPAYPEDYCEHDKQWFDFEKIVDNFISSMYNEIDESEAEHFEQLIRKIPYEEL